MTWTHNAAYILAWLTVVMQVAFGALEMFAPRWVFGRVFGSYYETRSSPVWSETEKLARNMGLYNWFLALGLMLSVLGHLGGILSSQFFLGCVAMAGAFGLLSVSWSKAFFSQTVLGILAFLLFL